MPTVFPTRTAAAPRSSSSTARTRSTNGCCGLTEYARTANPDIKILISLGWEHDDWTYISDDHTSGKNLFPASVVALVRKYQLDGFDIDDEGIGKHGPSGNIDQEGFRRGRAERARRPRRRRRGGWQNLFFHRHPGLRFAQVNKENMDYFDLINVQCLCVVQSDGRRFHGSRLPGRADHLGRRLPELRHQGDHLSELPSTTQGLAGIFNWTITADAACNYQYTRKIAADVGYHAKKLGGKPGDTAIFLE